MDPYPRQPDQPLTARIDAHHPLFEQRHELLYRIMQEYHRIDPGMVLAAGANAAYPIHRQFRRVVRGEPLDEAVLNQMHHRRAADVSFSAPGVMDLNHFCLLQGWEQSSSSWPDHATYLRRAILDAQQRHHKAVAVVISPFNRKTGRPLPLDYWRTWVRTILDHADYLFVSLGQKSYRLDDPWVWVLGEEAAK